MWEDSDLGRQQSLSLFQRESVFLHDHQPLHGLYLFQSYALSWLSVVRHYYEAMHMGFSENDNTETWQKSTNRSRSCWSLLPTRSSLTIDRVLYAVKVAVRVGSISVSVSRAMPYWYCGGDVAVLYRVIRVCSAMLSQQT